MLSPTNAAGEVTYQDLKEGSERPERQNPGFDKIIKRRETAAENGINYFCVDTWNIENTSRAELVEAVHIFDGTDLPRCATPIFQALSLVALRMSQSQIRRLLR